MSIDLTGEMALAEPDQLAQALDRALLAADVPLERRMQVWAHALVRCIDCSGHDRGRWGLQLMTIMLDQVRAQRAEQEFRQRGRAAAC